MGGESGAVIEQLHAFTTGTLLAILAFVSSLGFGLLYGIPVFLLGYDLTTPAVIAGGILVSHFGLLLIAGGYARVRRLAVPFRRPTTADAILIFGGLGVALAGTWGTGWILPGFEPPHTYLVDPITPIIVGTLAVAIPVEEYLFRGVIQGRLREATGPFLAIAGSSILFALLYLPTYVGTTGHPIFVLMLGAILGAAYERTQNLFVPLLIHVGYGLFLLGVVG